MINRFLKYVKIATDSNPENLQCPSSDIQWDLGKGFKRVRFRRYLFR